MTVINTNTGSLYAQQAMSTNSRGLSTVMQQLSTGKRINSAVDDVAGLAISTRLTSQIRGLNQAVRNANDGVSLIQTAEGATEQVTNMLQRMRELAIQASNDTNNTMDRSFLDGEFQQLKQEINRIGQNTQWNGANILDGTGGIAKDGKFAFQVGANSQQTIGAKLGNLQTFSKVDFAPKTPASANSAGFTQSLTLLDTWTNDPTGQKTMLGRVVSATVAGTAFKYTITQADLDKTLADPTALLSGTVSDGLASAINKGFPASPATFSALGDATGLLTVTDGTTVPNDTSKTDKFNKDGVTSVAGDLNAIDISDITQGDNANTALGAIDSAMQEVNKQRSGMGAVISRLQFAVDNLTNIAAKATESRSRIEDTDYSIATTELAKRNIIQQAAQAMLAQANQAPQMVLQLLK